MLFQYDAAQWPATRDPLDVRSAWFCAQDAESKLRLLRIHEPPRPLGPTRPWGHDSLYTGFTVPTFDGIFVYAHLDGFDRPLYVGKTARPVQRISQHANGSPWWPSVRRVIYERQANEVAAYWRELDIIGELSPTHNVIGKRRPDAEQAAA